MSSLFQHTLAKPFSDIFIHSFRHLDEHTASPHLLQWTCSQLLSTTALPFTADFRKKNRVPRSTLEAPKYIIIIRGKIAAIPWKVRKLGFHMLTVFFHTQKSVACAPPCINGFYY